MGAPLTARERKKVDTRRRFRAAGLELFAEHGFEATTAEQIVERAGGSLRSFFRYFGCKEGVLFDEDGLDKLLDRIEHAPPGESLVEGLRQAIGQLDREEDMGFRLLRHELMEANPSIRAYLHQLTTQLHPRLVEVAERRLGVRAASDPRPYSFALLFGGLAYATAMEHPRRQRRFVDGHLEAMRSLLITGDDGTPATHRPG